MKRGPGRRWVGLYVLCTGMLMIVLDVTVVNVALPSVQRSLHFSPSGLAWVVNAYLIAFGGLLLLCGRLGDLFGRRRMFVTGIVLFTIGSLACGMAHSPLVLVLARFAQGVSGAMTSAVILGVIVTMFPQPGEQAKALGIFAFVASAGGGIGLLAGGVLTQAINWHWIFFINVPIGVTTAFFARRYVPADAAARATDGIGTGTLDVGGAVLVTSALMLGVYTIVQPAAEYGWGSVRTLALAAASLVLLAGFVLREAKAQSPLLPLRLFRSRSVSGANLVQVLGAAGMFGTFFLGSLYFHKVLGYDPLAIGLAFLPVPVLMGGLSVWFTEPLVARFGPRRLCLVGIALITIGLALLSLAPQRGSYWSALLPALALVGLGAGTCFPSLMGLSMAGVAPSDAGVASGLVNTAAQVGGALGLAVIATVAAGRTSHLRALGRSLPAALTGGYHLGFLVAAGCGLTAVIIALVVLPRQGGAPASTEAVAGADAVLSVP